MRRMIIAAAGIAAVLLPVSAASAQGRYGHGHGGGYSQREVRQEMRECRRELRRADSRREYRRALRRCEREIAAARHGYRGREEWRGRDEWHDGGHDDRRGRGRGGNRGW